MEAEQVPHDFWENDQTPGVSPPTSRVSRPTPKAGDERQRVKFEAWIAAEPFGYEVNRMDSDSAWPGSYQDLSVNLAWQAWQEALKAPAPEPGQNNDMRKPLTDTDPMPFGKHKGKAMQDVDPRYLNYLWQHGVKHEDKPLANYIRNNLAALKLEDPDLIWD